MLNSDYLREDLTQSDKDRIYRMKLASDLVQSYYDRMSENHRSIDTENHEERVKALMEAVSLTLEYGESEQIRVGFFIANVFETILQNLKHQGLQKMSWLNKEAIQALYKREDLVLDLAEESAAEIGYACGCFVAENNPSTNALVLIEPARMGDVVGAETEYFDLASPEEIFQLFQEDLYTSYGDLEAADVHTRANAFLYMLQRFTRAYDIDLITQEDNFA